MKRTLTPEQMQSLQATVVLRDGRCYLAERKHRYAHECKGRTWAAHLYPQAGLKNLYRHGVWRQEGRSIWHATDPHLIEQPMREYLTLPAICMDSRNVIALCDQMHSRFDSDIDIRRECFDLLPSAFDHFYREFRLEAYVERHFGLAPFSLDPDGMPYAA